MTTTKKRCADVAPGDVIVFLGEPHRITHIAGPNAWGWPIAKSGEAWGISLDPAGTVEVLS